MIKVESNFNPDAVSPQGAMGMMQLMPATAERIGVSDPFDPVENIEGGVKYFNMLMTMFNNNTTLAIAGYNAGENAVIKYGYKIPPYDETIEYVNRVYAHYDYLKKHPTERNFDSMIAKQKGQRPSPRPRITNRLYTSRPSATRSEQRANAKTRIPGTKPVLTVKAEKAERKAGKTTERSNSWYSRVRLITNDSRRAIRGTAGFVPRPPDSEGNGGVTQVQDLSRLHRNSGSARQGDLVQGESRQVYHRRRGQEVRQRYYNRRARC